MMISHDWPVRKFPPEEKFFSKTVVCEAHRIYDWNLSKINQSIETSLSRYPESLKHDWSKAGFVADDLLFGSCSFCYDIIWVSAPSVRMTTAISAVVTEVACSFVSLIDFYRKITFANVSFTKISFSPFASNRFSQKGATLCQTGCPIGFKSQEILSFVGFCSDDHIRWRDPRRLTERHYEFSTQHLTGVYAEAWLGGT